MSTDRKFSENIIVKNWKIFNFKIFYRLKIYVGQTHFTKFSPPPPKLLQICKQVVTRLLSGRYQDVFALLVPSCCDKSGTSCYHLVTRLMTVTDLLQVVATRLIQTVRNKLLRACCHQLVNNLLRATISDLLEQQPCYKMITTCSRLVRFVSSKSTSVFFTSARFYLSIHNVTSHWKALKRSVLWNICISVSVFVNKSSWKAVRFLRVRR
jgi:hypothetical protein